ncbi:hypothetical protein HWD96_04045 [Pseudomonas putida]|uniref:hypothetical protein n=1 Tax=Pseudomonas putida TaxID=303 RepID=UPI001F51CF31|nr:hypothetical protein [Pseudomonas putida]MCI1021396.1 hypothetical protein [Pseudomonas putida]
MSKNTITDAAEITADEVLRIGKPYSANELRNIQKTLTSTAGNLQKLGNGWRLGSGLLGSLGDLLTIEQRQLLQDAGRLVESIGNNVTHAKEKRVRFEKDAKKRQEARLARAKQLVAAAYPLPCETNEQSLEVLKAALILNRAKQYQSYLNPLEFNRQVRGYLAEPARLYDSTLRVYRTNNLTSIRYGLLDEVTTELAYDDGTTVEERLQVLQNKVAGTVAQTTLTTDEQETLRQWKEAFPPAVEQQEDQA